MKNYLLCFFALALCLTLLPLAPRLFPFETGTQTDLLHILQTETGTVTQMTVEDYVLGVLEANRYGCEGEALKALAVAVRSQAVYCEQNRPFHEKAAFCDDPHCCGAFVTDSFSEQYVAAVSETKGLLVTYEGKAAAALTHESSGEYTAASESIYGVALPYLVEVCNVTEHVSTEQTWSKAEFFALLGLSEQTDPSDLVLAYDKSARVRRAEIGATVFTGEELANRLSLPSCCFTLTWSGDTVCAHCDGVGDGVGMSRTGACVLASQGRTFREILAFYYPQTEITSLS